MHKIKNNHLWLSLILFVGFFLRIYNLGKYSFWYDEALSLIFAKEITLKNIFEFGTYCTNPPLFFLVLKPWIYFLHSEFSIRLLTLFFGVLSIAAIYKIASRLFSKSVGLISSFIMAVSPLHIYYSQELRAYSLVTFLSLMSIWWLINVLENNKLSSWVLFILFNTLLIYSHNIATFMLIGENIFFFSFYRGYKKLLKNWLLCNFLIVILYSPLAIVILGQIFNIQLTAHYSWVPKPTFLMFFHTFQIFNIGYFGDKFSYFFSSLIFIYLFFVGIRSKIEVKTKVMLLLWISIPILLLIISSYLVMSIYIYRTLIYISPAYYIFIALGIKKIKRLSVLVMAGVLYIFIITIVLFAQYSDSFSFAHNPYHIGVFPRKDIKLASQFVKQEFQSGDLIAHTNKFTFIPFLCYLDKNFSQVELTLLENDSNNSDYMNVFADIFEKFGMRSLEVKEAFNVYDRIWIVTASSNYLNKISVLSEAIVEWADKNENELLKNRKFRGIKVFLYKTKK